MNWNWKVASTSLAQNEPNGLAPSGSPLFRSQDPKIVASSKASVRFSFQGPREHAYLHSGAILLRSTGRRTLVAPPPFVKLFFVTACFFLEPKHPGADPPSQTVRPTALRGRSKRVSRGDGEASSQTRRGQESFSDLPPNRRRRCVGLPKGIPQGAAARGDTCQGRGSTWE